MGCPTCLMTNPTTEFHIEMRIKINLRKTSTNHPIELKW